LAKRWLILHVLSGYETEVKALIEEKIKKEKMEQYIEEIFIPSENFITTILENEQVGKIDRKKVIFPGYVLVKLEYYDKDELEGDPNKNYGVKYITWSGKPRR